MPDWAPFAAPDEESWREAQRRRHLIKMTDSLAQIARDEGFLSCHTLLADTANKLRQLLLESCPSTPSLPQRMPGRPEAPAGRGFQEG
ncbi:MAG TPA: hypothetical protein VGN96_14685 [Roseococcus sp.]|jgi:hypothetical protein|nr:hypothetical protein [Roseococcus sp.]